MLQRIRGVIERDPRLSRVLHGGASALLGSVVALGVSAISLPLTVRYLGAEQYGIWVTVSTTVVLMSVLDLGIANSLTNMIAKAYAADDKAAAQRSYATALWTSLGVAAVAGAAAWALWGYVPWASLFRVHAMQLAHEAEVCAAIAVVFFLVSLPLKLINRVLGGYQETQIANYASLVNSVLGLVAILGVMAWGGSLVQLMLFYSAMMLAGTLALNVWVVLWRKRWITPWPSMVSAGSVRELMSTGSGFLLLQISALVVFNCDNLIIAHYLSAADVTPYSVTMRIATYASALQIALYPSLWPAYSEAYARGDYDWVRSVFWKAARYAMGAAGIAVAVLGLFGRPLIRWYVGAAAVPSEALILAICLWTLIATGMELESCLLGALNRVRLQAVLGVIAAALNVVLSVYWVRRIGSVGVVLGTVASYLLVIVWPQSLMAVKALYGPLPIVWAMSILRSRLGMRLLESWGVLRSARRETDPETILIAYLTRRVGDLVLMMPMIEALREEHPATRIEVAVNKAGADLLAAMPQIDRVWEFDLPGDHATTVFEALRLSWVIAKEYLQLMSNEPPPSICIVPRWGDDGFRSGELAYLSRARRRVGFDITTLSERLPFAERTLTERVSGGDGMHEPAKALHLLRSVGLLSRFEPESVSTRASSGLCAVAAKQDWSALASRLGIEIGERFAVIAPGATELHKRWPLERWVAIASLLGDSGLSIVVLSGRSDSSVAEGLHELLSRQLRGRFISVAGVTTLPETAALLSHCEIFLGADSGPGHMAGAMGVRTVVQFVGIKGAGPRLNYSPDRWRPFGPHVKCVPIPHAVPPCKEVCTASFPHCVLIIEVDEMLRVTSELLSNTAVNAVG